MGEWVDRTHHDHPQTFGMRRSCHGHMGARIGRGASASVLRDVGRVGVVEHEVLAGSLWSVHGRSMRRSAVSPRW